MARANQTCSSTATYWIAIAIYWLSAACVTGLIGVTKAIGQGLCKPTLSVNDVQFSPIHPETLVRNWTAVVSVDASRCRANFRGTFDIVFHAAERNCLRYGIPRAVHMDAAFGQCQRGVWP